MKKSILLIALVALLLSGCGAIFDFFGIGKDDGGDNEPTLAEEVVAEYRADLAASAARALSSRALTTDLTTAQIDALVAAANAAIAAADLANSTELDKIVEALVEGVAEQVKTYATSSTPVDVSSALVVAAKSAVESMGKAGREGNVSATVGTTEKAIAYVTARMVQVVSVNVVNAAVRDLVKAEVVREAVAALDAAPTIGTAEVEDAIAGIVREVSAVVADDGEVFKTVVSAATEASVGLTKAGGAAIAAQVASAASQGVIDAAVDGEVTSEDAASLALSIAAEVSTAAGATGSAAATITNQISTAFGAATGVTITIDANAMSAIASETPPMAVAYVGLDNTATTTSITVSQAATVYLPSSSSAGSPYTAVDIEWRRLNEAPMPQPGTPWFITVSGPGTFSYELIATNQGGRKSARAIVTVTSTYNPTSVADRVAQGLACVANSNIVGAKNAFAAALAIDSTNVEAKVWGAFLDLANIGTNADIVSLMRDNFGFHGYPDSLGLLASNLWFTKTYYNGTDGFKEVASTSGLRDVYIRGTFTASDTAGTYINYYDSPGSSHSGQGTAVLSNGGPHYFKFYYDETDNRFEPSFSSDTAILPSGAKLYVESHDIADLTDPFGLLPEITAPSWAPSLANDRSMSGFGLCILANIINNNATGLNSILDKVVSGVFGTELDAVIATIQGLEDTDSITIRPYIIEGMGGEAPKDSGETFDVVIHKRELLAFAAQLELLKGLFQYVSSYDLSYPIGSVFRFDFGNPNATGDVDHDGIPNFIETAMSNGVYGPLAIASNTLLDDRSQTVRTAAKASILAGLTDLITAATAIQAELGKTEAEGNPYLPYMPSEEWDDEADAYVSVDKEAVAAQAAQFVGQGLTYASDLKTALEGNSVLTVVVEEDDESTPDVNEEMSVEAKPSLLFDSAVFSLDNLYQTNAGKLQRYVEIRTYVVKQEQIGTDSEQQPIYQDRYDFYAEDENEDPLCVSRFAAWNEGVHPPALGANEAYKALRVGANVTNINKIWLGDLSDLWPEEFRYMPIGGDISDWDRLVDSEVELTADPDAKIANWFIGYTD